MTAALVEARAATVGWGRRAVLRDVSLSIGPGDYLGLVGPNGSGKSTLIRALLGLSAPLAGTIVRGTGWRPGHVPQRDTLSPLFRFRALEVAAMGAETAAWLPGTRNRERRAAAREALAAVGMASHADRVFRDLSGGQKQRVLIARALAAGPTALVLDEPTTGMDIRSEAELLGLIRNLRRERGIAVLLVTHSLHIVADEAETVGIIEGDRVRFGPPDLVLTSATLSEIYHSVVHVDQVRGKPVIHVAAEDRP